MKNLFKGRKNYYRLQIFRQQVAGASRLLLILFLIFCPLYAKYCEKTTPEALKQTITTKVVEVEAVEDKYIKRGYRRCSDPIVCIRDIGEERGFGNKDILIAIRIAKAESGMVADKISPPNDNGTLDVGVMQINDIHGKRISREDRLDFEKNISFAWTLREEQKNWNAWSVCKNGKVDCSL